MTPKDDLAVVTSQQDSKQQGAPVARGPWLLTGDGFAIYTLMPNPDQRSIRRGHPAEINRFYGGFSCSPSVSGPELHAAVASVHKAANAYPRLVSVLIDALEYFEQREDASNEGDGWKGNEEMSRAQEIRELLKSLGEL